jgi:hypothetical protein
MRKITTLIFSTAFVVLIMAGSAWSQEDTKSLLKQLLEDTDRFSDSVDSHLDNSKIDGSQLEDEINRYVDEFDDAINTLEGDWKNGRDAKGSAEGVGVRAKTINNFLNKYKDRFTPTIHTEWNSVKMDIGRIAKANKIEIEW